MNDTAAPGADRRPAPNDSPAETDEAKSDTAVPAREPSEEANLAQAQAAEAAGPMDDPDDAVGLAW